MFDVLLDCLIDTLKIIPFLFITFLFLELIEHKLSDKSKKILEKDKKFGPVIGGVLGGLPQCGFGAVAANLFANHVISVGTVIAIFLSTSDEMLPVMISENANISELLLIILFKVFLGISVGLIVDLIYRPKIKNKSFHDMCEHDHCDCEHEGIFLSSLIHTLKTSLFILFANILIGTIIHLIGEDALKSLISNAGIFNYFISSLIGLIPNCAASVVITEVYLDGVISVGTLLSGLLTGSGIGLLLLFKTNRNFKENISILLIIYFVGVLVGFLTDLVI